MKWQYIRFGFFFRFVILFSFFDHLSTHLQKHIKPRTHHYWFLIIVNFLTNNCFNFANFMKDTSMINFFNSGNRNIAKIKSQHHQVITTITSEIMKLKPTIKIPIVTNDTFFTVITFSEINFFTQINSIIIYYNTTFMSTSVKIKKLIFIRLKKIVIKIICHLIVFKFASAIV